eukprot:4262377-Pyramimonas_sp.AAC.1
MSRKTRESALQKEAGVEQQVSNLATVMGMPSFRSIGSDFDRRPPLTAQRAPRFPFRTHD